MFSERLPPQLEPNAVSRALDALRAREASFADLTESNPTRVEIPYPDGLLAALADAAALRYEPHAFGCPEARAAVAAGQARRGVRVGSRRIQASARNRAR